MASARPTLHVLAGPNGAGKSTLYEYVLQHDPVTRPLPFINADRIQLEELGDTRMDAAYRAAELAEQRRRGLLAEHRSFITESTFSHASKLALIRAAREAGYRIAVFHINVASPEISVSRVAQRVDRGGHPVPEHKIHQRYHRNQALIREAILMADAGLVFDNSERFAGPKRKLELRKGFIIDLSTPVPTWIQTLYRQELRQHLRLFRPF